MSSEDYDTLDDVDPFYDLIDLYTRLFGDALKAPDLCGVLTTGTLDLSPSQHAQWGGAPATFGEHPEVWHARSFPKGRIGMPLIPGEVRLVSVLVRKSATHRVARTTNIKMWRLPPCTKLDDVIQNMFDAQDAIRHGDRSKRTYGAMGMGVHGLHLFGYRNVTNPTHFTSQGCQAVLSSVAKITRLQDGTVSKMEASTLPHYVVAAALAGFQLGTNTPMPQGCEEQYDELTWDGLCGHLGVCFRDELLHSGYPIVGETPLKLMMTAEDVFEQVSLVGYLDMRADPFFRDSLSDDMLRPSGLPLVLVLSVMMATRPEKWQLPPTRLDDAYATKEAALFVESVVPSVLALDESGPLGGEQPYTFELVMKICHTELAEVIHKLRVNKMPSKEHRKIDHRKLERSVHETMYFLFCLGVAVCQDLFGLPPSSDDDITGQYTRYGFAAQLADPMVESRTQSAYAMELGNIVERWPTLRTSTRGRRQLALADVLVEVNEWLCTGKYRGTILAPTTGAPSSVPKNELISGSPFADGTPLNFSAVRSAKKKKRLETTVLLAERSKARDASMQYYANESVRSLFKPNQMHERRINACSEKICGAALNNASGIFCDVLQLGGCGGPTCVFEFSSYLISPTMSAQCAHCENAVHVVQSIAIAPEELRNCAGCGHPRCLACVSRDMERATPPPLKCKLCQEE